MSKKLLVAIVIIVAGILGVAVGVLLVPQGGVVSQEQNVQGTLEEIMSKVYAGISQENLPMMLTNMEVTDENVEYYVGTSDIDYKEALVSESGVGSIAHSVVLVRLNDASKAGDVVTKIKQNADPRKWICVEASNVIVKSKGDLVILIMSNDELAPKLDANFEGLK